MDFRAVLLIIVACSGCRCLQSLTRTGIPHHWSWSVACFRAYSTAFYGERGLDLNDTIGEFVGEVRTHTGMRLTKLFDECPSADPLAPYQARIREWVQPISSHHIPTLAVRGQFVRSLLCRSAERHFGSDAWTDQILRQRISKELLMA